MRALVILLAACNGAGAVNAAPPDAPALDAPIAVDVDAAAGDAATDAQADAKGCDPGCHWYCFGGLRCVDGVAWLYGDGPRECCHYGEPWPEPGPICSWYGHECEGRTCVAPDSRYASCLYWYPPYLDTTGGLFERLRLLCPEGEPKVAGAPCADDSDCRPAAGTARLRCATATTHTCVTALRPPRPDDYGASCEYHPDDVSWLNGETAIISETCFLCQVMHVGDGCLRQGCTIACVYDEDCPDGSVCLCDNNVAGYCAGATDRVTPEGRAAGLAPCPSEAVDAGAPDAPAPDAARDAAPDAKTCDSTCLRDCGGGSECVNGVAWVNGFGPHVECCSFGEPADPLACAALAFPCDFGTCVEPDPRYASCLGLLRPSPDFGDADVAHVLLYCPQGAPKAAGSPCADDGDCRPADGVWRLRCDTAATHTCVREFRPPPPDDYGASCGLEAADVTWLDGESVVSFAPACSLCQVMRIGDGCLQQGCTTACVFDEDCPAGSICLCGGVPGYCAAATDRETPEGRAAGLAPCP